MICKYVDGVTSSGKSVVLRKKANELSAKGHNTIIVLPTIDLIREHVCRFETDYTNQRVEPFFTGDDRVDALPSVTLAVKHAIETTMPDEGRIILVTHQTFSRIRAEHCLSEWHVLIDEEMDVFSGEEINLHHSHKFVTDNLKLCPQGPKYGTLKVVDAKAIKKVLDNPEGDEAWKLVNGVCRSLLSPWAVNYTILTSYNALVSEIGSKRKLIVYTIVTHRFAEQYASFTVFCARFTETLHYLMWQSEGVAWERDEELCSQLRIQAHEGYERLKIYYGYEGHFSKKLRNTHPDTFKQFVMKARDIMNGQPFIWLVNKDVKNDCELFRVAGGENIKAKSHGLNKYDHVHHAIVGGAFNKTPGASKFLEDMCNVSAEQQTISGVNQKIYQAVSRTSMRKLALEQDRCWVVPSRSNAEYLSGIFVGSSVLSLGLDQPAEATRGRPPKHGSANERKLRSKLRKKMEREQTSGFIPEIAPEMISVVSIYRGKDGDVNTIESISDFVARFRGTIFPHLYSNRGDCLLMKEKDFIQFLKNQSKTRYMDKHDVPLISPAFWNPLYDGERPRGKHNAICSYGFMIDVDGGEMRPEDLATIVPHLELHCYSTFNNRKDEQRYRVYIPATRPTSNPQYKAITSSLIHAIESNGYTSKKELLAKPRVSANSRLHGIDMSKLGGFSLFYLPCQAENGPKSFFKSFDKPPRMPLDVNDWLENIPYGIEVEDDAEDRPIYYEPATGEINTEQQSAINEAMDWWMAHGTGRKQGYVAISILFSKLCRINLPCSKISNLLYEAASMANSPEDRRKQVRGLMETWKTKRRY
ncbi:hypothetical protein [Methylobacterium dankookense]|uniref:Helicase/UvrB N-terminal domain-containing protein n=1 Tax=Methylobacterium dankookense TaxID=560405 RepID=A0A564G026_9HYPH|nr:hypothetical protein [Methylobacterium dankookense]GJD57070.1 hypothetical protein IFDJLNFL_2970 [Methylobacterium dankookense]VUF13572.1 hypothetical protein MTDSW087_03279 [Methylobacterium dankookense]